MPFWLSDLCAGITEHWIEATPTDYGRVALLIVILGWVLTRRWAT